MTHELRLILALCLMSAAWFLTFVLLVRALQTIIVQRRAIGEGIEALKLAAHILAAQDAVILSYRPPEPPSPGAGSFSSQA
jgi:hypothetical protein